MAITMTHLILLIADLKNLFDVIGVDCSRFFSQQICLYLDLLFFLVFQDIFICYPVSRRYSKHSSITSNFRMLQVIWWCSLLKFMPLWYNTAFKTWKDEAFELWSVDFMLNYIENFAYIWHVFLAILLVSTLW